MKKIYSAPMATVYEVSPLHVICGSGGDSADVSFGDDNTDPITESEEIILDAASYRSTLWGR